jgi:ferredoxin
MIWGRPAARVDERDTMFARMARRPGTPAYEDYYARRPDLTKGDDHLRSMPELLRPGGADFDPTICADAERWFRAIDDIAPDPPTVTRFAARLRSAPDLTSGLQALASELGAVASGACGLDPSFVYTHKGRCDRDYGQRVAVDHGVVKWPTLSERCYGHWRQVGTDCGICMAVCPFSHRDTRVHNLVRGLVTRAAWLAPALVRADDLVYGREWHARHRPARGTPSVLSATRPRAGALAT